MFSSGLVEIVFVVDLADDLLEHVLDCHHAGHAAVFVHDDGDVVAIGAKIAQQTLSGFDSGMNTAGRSISRI